MTPGLLALKAPEPSLVAKMHPSLMDFHSATKLLREICFLALWLKAKMRYHPRRDLPELQGVGGIAN